MTESTRSTPENVLGKAFFGLNPRCAGHAHTAQTLADLISQVEWKDSGTLETSLKEIHAKWTTRGGEGWTMPILVPVLEEAIKAVEARFIRGPTPTFHYDDSGFGGETTGAETGFPIQTAKDPFA